MLSRLLAHTSQRFSKRYLVCITLSLAVALSAGSCTLNAQGFSSGSDGSDGALDYSNKPPGTYNFDPTKFNGSQVQYGIFNFTTINIPSGITLKFTGNLLISPVFWLATGDVTIAGTLDLSGANGIPEGDGGGFQRVPSIPGSGGYAGGVGGSNTQAALVGDGPGGGAPGGFQGSGGQGGTFSGNQFLIPLVGGSGGGGGAIGGFGAGGGAGGGALLVASSTQIVFSSGGAIFAYGGSGGNNGSNPSAGAGGGSGGAIRLVSNSISGQGTIQLYGGTNTGGIGGGNGAGYGVARLEASSISYNGVVNGSLYESTPFPLLLPTTGVPSARVVSINNVQITENPSGFPDIVINTTSPVPVVIQAQNVPLDATVQLTILDENGNPDTVVSAPALTGTLSQSTTTVNIAFPFGPSRGLTKVTWSQ